MPLKSVARKEPEVVIPAAQQRDQDALDAQAAKGDPAAQNLASLHRQMLNADAAVKAAAEGPDKESARAAFDVAQRTFNIARETR